MSTSSNAVPVDCSAHVAEAEDLMVSGNFEEAANCLTEAIEILISSTEEHDMQRSLPLFLLKAECRQKLGNFESALEVYCQLEALLEEFFKDKDPEQSLPLLYESLLGQARVYDLIGDRDSALATLERVLRDISDPEDIFYCRAVFQTGECLLACDRIEDGISAMTSSLEELGSREQDLRIHLDLLVRFGSKLIEHGSPEEIESVYASFLDQYQEVIDPSPLLAKLYLLMGRSFLDRGLDDSEEYFQKSVLCYQECLGDTCPELAEPLFLAAQFRLMGAHPVEAIAMLEKAFELSEGQDSFGKLNAEISRDLGQLHLEVTEQYEEAITYFEQAVAWCEAQGESQLGLARDMQWLCGWCHVKSGQVGAGIEIFSKVLPAYYTAEDSIVVQRALDLALQYQHTGDIRGEYILWHSVAENLGCSKAKSKECLRVHMQLASSCMALGKDKEALECIVAIRDFFNETLDKDAAEPLPALENVQTDIVELDHLKIPGLQQMSKLSDNECLFIKQNFMQLLSFLEQDEHPDAMCLLLEKATRASVRVAGDKAPLYSKLAEIYGARGDHELAKRAQKLAEPRATF